MSSESTVFTPPHSIEFEQATLSGVMLDNEIIDDVIDLVSRSDFYTSLHQDIYQAILQLYQQDKPFDMISVAALFDAQNRQNPQDDKHYLAEMVKNTMGAANTLYYARTVREKAVLRRLIHASNDIVQSCYNTQLEAREIMDRAEQSIQSINQFNNTDEQAFSTARDLIEKSINQIDERFNSSSSITGIETRFPEFDNLTSGLQNGDLIIVAGRPSMGKTTLGMNLIENACVLQEHYGAVFSMEMPEDQLMNRMISSMGKIPSERIKTGQLMTQDWPKLNQAVQQISNANLYFNDKSNLTINQLRGYARKMDRQARKTQEKNNEPIRGLEIVMVDYLQLMNSDKENRTQEISDISRGLKHLAKELNCPVIALSQLNRSLENRANKRPMMSDLRESGAIEQDADLIVFVYRDEVYNKETEDKGKAEVILAKHRNGALGTTVLGFEGEYTRFDNVSTSPFNSEY